MLKKIVFIAIGVCFLLQSSLLAFESSYYNSKIGIHCDKELHKKAFDICYSCKERHPIMVIYEINGDLVDAKNLSRKYISIRPDYQLPTRCRSNTKDYSHTGYDRGHNATNAAFDYEKNIQKETFLMSNITPQKPQLNRRLWAKIERFARMQAKKYDKISVITGSCGNSGYLHKKVGIPKWWYKIIVLPDGKKIAFLVPNTNKHMSKAKAKKYLSSLATIEDKCKINF